MKGRAFNFTFLPRILVSGQCSFIHANPLRGLTVGSRKTSLYQPYDSFLRYLEGALVADHNSETSSTNRRQSRDYIPSSKAGSRLPHMQLRMLNASSNEVLFGTFRVHA